MYSWSPQAEAASPSGVMETTRGLHTHPHTCMAGFPSCTLHFAQWYCCQPSSFSVTTQACFHGCPRLLTGSGFNMGLLPSGRLAPPIYSRKSSQVPLCLPLPLATFFLWPHIRDTREAGGGGHAGLGHRTGVLGSLQKRNRAQALRANSDS